MLYIEDSKECHHVSPTGEELSLHTVSIHVAQNKDGLSPVPPHSLLAPVGSPTQPLADTAWALERSLTQTPEGLMQMH